MFVPRWLPPFQSRTDSKSIWSTAWPWWRWWQWPWCSWCSWWWWWWRSLHWCFCRCHHYHHCDWCAAVSFVNVVPWGPWNTFGVNLLASSHLTSPFAVPWFRSSRIRPHPNLALGFLNSPESQPKIGPIPISVLDKNAPGFFTVFSHITKLKNVHRVAWKTSKTCMFWKIAFKIVKNHIFCNLAQAPNMCFPHVKAQKMLIANCCNLLVSRARLSKTLPLFGASLPS